jgi:hypothetical protein
MGKVFSLIRAAAAWYQGLALTTQTVLFGFVSAAIVVGGLYVFRPDGGVGASAGGAMGGGLRADWMLVSDHEISEGQAIKPSEALEQSGSLVLFAAMGTPVLAATDGEIVEKADIPGFGTVIEIKGGRNLPFIIYYYLDQVMLEKGATVTKGDTIGLTGKVAGAVEDGVMIEIFDADHEPIPFSRLGKTEAALENAVLGRL